MNLPTPQNIKDRVNKHDKRLSFYLLFVSMSPCMLKALSEDVDVAGKAECAFQKVLSRGNSL